MKLQDNTFAYSNVIRMCFFCSVLKKSEFEKLGDENVLELVDDEKILGKR